MALCRDSSTSAWIAGLSAWVFKHVAKQGVGLLKLLRQRQVQLTLNGGLLRVQERWVVLLRLSYCPSPGVRALGTIQIVLWWSSSAPWSW